MSLKKRQKKRNYDNKIIFSNVLEITFKKFPSAPPVSLINQPSPPPPPPQVILCPWIVLSVFPLFTEVGTNKEINEEMTKKNRYLKEFVQTELFCQRDCYLWLSSD